MYMEFRATMTSWPSPDHCTRRDEGAAVTPDNEIAAKMAGWAMICSAGTCGTRKVVWKYQATLFGQLARAACLSPEERCESDRK